jgi:hypothetical protein
MKSVLTCAIHEGVMLRCMFGFFLAMLMFVPRTADAHTRWFAENDLVPYATDEPHAMYLIGWACIAAAVLAIAYLFEKKGWLRLEMLTPHASHAPASVGPGR